MPTEYLSRSTKSFNFICSLSTGFVESSYSFTTVRSRTMPESFSQSEEPALLKYRSSNWFILLTVCFASFSVSNCTWTFRSVYSLAHTFFRTHSYTAWYVPIAFPNRHHRSSRSKIVPVLPFSLKTRSDIDEEHSKLHRAGTVI